MTFYDLFRLLILVAYFGWLASLARELITNSIERARFFARPERALFVLLGVVLMTMFLVGICIPAIGEITVFSIANQNFRIWGIGLIGSFVWLAFGGWRMANESG
jgi:hypothetical protein